MISLLNLYVKDNEKKLNRINILSNVYNINLSMLNKINQRNCSISRRDAPEHYEFGHKHNINTQLCYIFKYWDMFNYKAFNQTT